MALNDVDPWNAQTNDPNVISGQAPSFAPQSTTTPSYLSTSSGNSQLANGSSQVMPASTSTTYAPVPGTGTAPAAPAPSYAPIDVGYNGNVAGTGENVSAALLQHYADAGTPQTTNYAAGAYGQFNDSTPANMSSYYDNASRNAANTINTQMAARGSYGSSNAVGVLSNAETNLRAQQAKDEAGYGLQRAGLAGTLASSADSSGRANSADELNWMGGLADLGFRNQNEAMSRYQQGNDNAFRGAEAASGIEARTGSAAIRAQQDLLVQTLMAGSNMTFDQVIAAANAYNQQKTDSNQTTQDLTQAVTGGAKAYNAYNA